MLLISTTFPYLSDRRLGDAEANHADGNCHSSECESDSAQSLLHGSQSRHIRAPSRRYQGTAFSGPSYFEEAPTAVRDVLRSRRSTRVSKAAASAPDASPDLV